MDTKRKSRPRSLKQAVGQLKSMGVDVVEGDPWYGKSLDLWSPSGKRWFATDAHGLNAEGTTVKELLDCLWPDVEKGFIDCTEPDCEGCE